MDFEKIIQKALGKIQAEGESILFISGKPGDKDFTLLLWVKPSPDLEADELEEDEEEDEEKGEDSSPFPGTANFSNPKDLHQYHKGSPSNPEEEEEEGEISVMNGSFWKSKLDQWSWEKPKGPEHPRATREMKKAPVSVRDSFRFSDNPDGHG